MIQSSRFLRLHIHNPLQGPDVECLQAALTQLGYLKEDVSAVGFEVKTEAALKIFQSEHQLLDDGVVGPLTWKVINAVTTDSEPFPSEPEPLTTSIKINLRRRILTLSRNGQTQTFPVGIGKPSTPSPIGSWKIIQKAMNPGGPFGSRWMRLNVPWGHYGIHGTNNPKSIGRAYSHGCIRLHNADIESFYDSIPLGTPVLITGPKPKNRLLKIGSRGADVAELQNMLTALGYYKGVIDGIYGTSTAAAVKSFQSAHKLKPTGNTNNRTYNRILSSYEKLQGDLEP